MRVSSGFFSGYSKELPLICDGTKTCKFWKNEAWENMESTIANI